MAVRKQKLELTWLGKDEGFKLEPRILIEDPNKSYGEPKSDNMLIHGDNLLALKALEQDFTGKIKCIYIDPPYNTGNAFTKYDDNLEHSIWLSLMKPRLLLLKNLLSSDGVIFISIDDDEQAYLKILCDEVFERKNFCGTFIWEKKRKPSFLNSQMGIITEYILSYAKNRLLAPGFIFGKVNEDETYPLYNAGNSRSILNFKQGSLRFLKHKDGIYEPQSFREETSNVVLINQLVVENSVNKNDIKLEGEWRYGQDSIDEQIEKGEYYIVKTLKFRPRRVLSNNLKEKKIHNLLDRAHFDMATYEDSSVETVKLFGDDPFDYPKPEKLLFTLISSVTSKDDFVLDSFLGSGTTCAVAHKMGRKHIGIEFGNHANTHCLPRLKKVVDGTDNLPLSETIGWKGGGGFKFYNLAPSLLRKDNFGNLIIDSNYNPNQLSQAMCKHESFRYFPDEKIYWKQGKSTENDFIFVTTGFITVEQLDKIHSEMKEEESLLICAKSFAPECENKYSNITVKKIPQMILGKCEFSKDNYDLNIIKVTEDEAEKSNE